MRDSERDAGRGIERGGWNGIVKEIAGQGDGERMERG